jgi:hypothetical protein
MFVAFIYCLWLFALGNIVPELFSEDFQDQAFKESQLDETIEQPCRDFLAHTSEVCKGAHRYNEYSAIQGQSWLMGNRYILCRL